MTTGASATTQADALVAPYQAALAVSGPPWHSPLAHQGHVLLAQPEVHLGQMAANDLVLSDPSVSRYHAVIRWTPAGYTLEDLGSTGGTFVQGVRISGPVVLQAGQHIRVGHTELVLQALEGHQHAPGLVHPHVPGVGAMAAIPAHVFDARALHRGEARAWSWLKGQVRRHYWRVFLVGLIAYILSVWALTLTVNVHGVPLPVLLASMLVPVTFVLFCWEEGAFVDMPPTVVGLAFVSGGVMGLLLAWLLENYLVNGDGFGPSLVIALCEEAAKALAVVWFLRDRRLRSEMDGLALGAAAGMGFAALETAGYGFGQLLLSYQSTLGGSISKGEFLSSVAAMVDALNGRMQLAFFGHGVWTAIVVAALWRDRRQRLLRITFGVVLAFAIAVTLHTLWDGFYTLTDVNIPFTNTAVSDSDVPQWILGFIGLFILRFFIMESIARAKLGPGAPPPPALARALAHYVTHPIHGLPRHPAAPQSYATAASAAAAVTPGMSVHTVPAPSATTGDAPQANGHDTVPATESLNRGSGWRE